MLKTENNYSSQTFLKYSKFSPQNISNLFSEVSIPIEGIKKRNYRPAAYEYKCKSHQQITIIKINQHI
jgi:hypothetical protein